MRTFWKFKKIFAVFMLLIMLSLPAFQARALFGIPEPVFLLDPPTTATLGAIAGSTAATAGSTAAMNAQLILMNKSIGLPGEGFTVSAILKGVGAVCSSVDKLEQVASSADTVNSFSLIGGSPIESAALTTKIASLQLLQKCYQAQVTALNAAPVTSLIQGQELTRKQATLSTKINEIGVRVENLKARQSASFKEVLKAVALKLVLNFSQKLTTSLLNKMIAKYKIGNYLQYGDALATQVYTTDYVQKNYSADVQQQYILRGLLQNQGYQGKIMPMVRKQASDALGFDTSKLSFAEPDYYVKLAAAGGANANPYYRQTVAELQADDAKGQGKVQAQSEISQGQGFVPVRNCQGAVDQQKSIDKQNLQVSYNADVARQVYQRLMAQRDADFTTVKQEDLEKASKDVENAEKAMSALPQQAGTPFLKMCDAVSNPASFVSGALQNYLKKHFDEASSLKTDNLPFYGNFLVAVADNLLTNVITGGQSNLKILTEAGFQAGNILASDSLIAAGGIPTQLRTGDSANPNMAGRGGLVNEKSGVKFELSPSDDNKQLTLSWSSSSDQVKSVMFIQGTNLGDNFQKSQPPSGSITINTPSSDTIFTLNLYDGNSPPQVIDRIGLDFKVSQLPVTIPNGFEGDGPGDLLNDPPPIVDPAPDGDVENGDVQGAYAGRPSESLRGSAAESLRGGTAETLR